MTKLIVIIGNLKFKNHNFKISEKKFKTALAKKPNILIAKIGLLNNYYTENKALQFNKLLVKLEPNDSLNPLVLELLGMMNYRGGNDELAIDYFRRADSTKGGYRLSYDALLGAANIYLKHNLIKEAGLLYEKAIARSKDNAHAHAGIGFCLASNPNFIYDKALYTKANAHFRNALKIEPNNAIFLSYIGITEYLMHNYKNAETNLRQAVAIKNTDATIYNSLAMTLSKLNKFDEARLTINKARTLDPNNNKYFVNSGIIETELIAYQLQSDTAHSTIEELANINSYYNQALSLNADPNIININRGYAYFKANKGDSAIIIYNNIQGADSLVSAGRDNNIGVVNAIDNNNDNADKKFDSAIALDANEEYPFINYNKELLAANGNKYYFKTKNIYTSLVYYYLPLTPYEAKFSNNLNVPENAVLASSSDEIMDGEKYKFKCNERVKFTLTVIKSIKNPKVLKDPFAFCNSKSMCKR